MARSENQKLKILYLLDILRCYSDEDHPITAAKICEKLEIKGISAERKSVYSDIEALRDYGCDIIKSGPPKRGFFLGSRDFEEAEIYLLCDAVRVAKFISPKKTRQLITKLDSLLSVAQAQKREKQVFFDSKLKCKNEEIYYNIDKICKAIETKKQISLEYSVRKLSENREPLKTTKQMTVSPYAMTWKEDHYYLICNNKKYDNLMHLRLDRMRSVEVIDMPYRHFSEVSDYRDYFDIADYVGKLFDMHSGKICSVEFCCKKSIAEQVFDRFSENIFITNVTDDEFCFGTKAALSEALVTFIINYGDSIKVVSPEVLKNMVAERAEKVLLMYKNGN